MKIIDFTPSSLAENSKLKAAISGPEDGAGAQHVSYLVSIPAKGTSERENHSEYEVLSLLKGQARIECGHDCVAVEAGQVVILEPFETHLVTNIGANELRLVTTFWNEAEAIAARLLPDPSADDSPVYVIPAYPTPNGDLHYGHLSGPFIAADILRRGVVSGGGTSCMMIGTLGHQNHIALTSHHQNASYYGVANHFTTEIRKTLAATAIEPDIFIPPVPTDRYKGLLKLLFQELKERGLVIDKTCQVLRTREGEIRTEAFVSGSCPHCGASCSGNDCEKCGRFHDDVETRDPVCALSGAPLFAVPANRYYFKLEAVRSQLESAFAKASFGPQVRAYINWVLSEPLRDFPISQIQPDGIELDEEGFEDQRFFATFEHGARYLYSIAEASGLYDPEEATARDVLDAAREVIRRDAPRAAVLFGNDNAYVRLIMTPALLLGHLEGEWAPTSFHMNHFLLLDGAKFSTSRRHAIWGREMTERLPVDIVRLCAVLEGPTLWDTDFSMETARRLFSDEIFGGWGGWLHQVHAQVAKHCNSCAPDPGDWDMTARLTLAKLQSIADTVDRMFTPEAFSVDLIAQTVRELVRTARTYAANCRPWKGALDQRQLRTQIALELMAARILAQILVPVAPGIGARMNEALGQPVVAGQRVAAGDLRQWLTPGTPIKGLEQAIPIPLPRVIPKVQEPTD